MNDAVMKNADAGIINVRQRLELLYPDKYDLQIKDEEEAFIIHLKVELAELEKSQVAIDQPTTEILYA